MTESTRRTAGDEHDDEADVIEYLVALWGRRWLILAAALLCGLAAFVPTYCAAPVFEASAQVLVPEPANAGAQATGGAKTFGTAAGSRSIAAQVVKEFHLDAAPLRLSPDRFIQDALSVESTRDGSIVVLGVRLGDRHLVAKVTNRVAELALEQAVRTARNDGTRGLKVLQAQLEAATGRVDEAQNALERFRRESGIDLLRDEVDTMLGRRREIVVLDGRIATEQRRAGRAEKERKLAELASKESEFERLEKAREIAETVRSEVATRIERARVEQAGEAQAFVVLDAAIPPDLPVARRVARNTVAGLAAGFLVSVVGILAFQVLMSSRSAPRRVTEESDAQVKA